MIKTAKVISVEAEADTVGLFDKVVAYHEKLGKEMTLRVVTTLRSDAGKGLISKESPVGKALLGRKSRRPGPHQGQRRRAVRYGDPLH